LARSLGKGSAFSVLSAAGVETTTQGLIEDTTSVALRLLNSLDVTSINVNAGDDLLLGMSSLFFCILVSAPVENAA
jgi:hypothetical protein